jgi:hypothetical protein
MAFKQIVKTHVQPSIKLIKLDDFDNSAKAKTPSITTKQESAPDFSQTAGTLSPFIKIGGQTINFIDYLVIDESGFIPTISLTFIDTVGEFSGSYFPKRDLLISVFINNSNPKLKPVRSDYLITSIKSIPLSNRGPNITLSQDTTYIVKGELFVPRLYNNISKSYPNMTSVNAIKKVCSELGLGYAQNEFTPTDTMTWININTSPSNFIREIVNHTYQDDDSFFSGFISKEMIMTMINVNEQMKNTEADLTFSNSSDPLSGSLTQNNKNSTLKDALSESTFLNHLTTFKSSANKANYIYEANLISDQGGILKTEGYKKKIYYYDHFESKKSKFKDFYTTPLNTPGLSVSSMLIPDDEGLDEIGHKKWMNINYGNTHEHWNAARVFNAHNLKELDKINLRVLLKGINFQVIRGSVIPVIMTQSMAEKIKKEMSPDGSYNVNPTNESLDAEVADTQLSGWYYVKEAKYTFDPTDPHQFITELILARREWSPSKIKFNANA